MLKRLEPFKRILLVLKIFGLSNSESGRKWKKARSFLIQHLTTSIIYFKASSIFALFLFISANLTPIVTGIFSVPFYAPDFIENSQYFFFIHYILEAGMSVYHSFVFLVLDALPLCLLIMIHGLVMFLRLEFREMNTKTANLRRCVEFHRQLTG